MDSKINSAQLFSSLFFFWRTMGFRTSCNKYFIRLYDAFVTIFVTFGFPAHLLLGALFATNSEDIFIDLAIGISSVACTLKYLSLRPRLSRIHFVTSILQLLDARVCCETDTRYYTQRIRRMAIFMMRSFTAVYLFVPIMALLAALWSGELLYPGYVILDWRSSSWKYWVVVSFQTYGFTMQVTQNIISDAYGPIVLCLLSGYVHLLARRVTRIGSDGDMEVESDYKALVLCIEDYKLLRGTTRLVERIISFSYMVQFTAVGFNVVTLIYLLFYANNLFAYANYIGHTLGIMLQLFPCCYYGSILQAEFRALSYAIFRCNWLRQPRPFQRNLITFVELTLKDVTVSAGGMMSIHLDSFFATCKLAYSFYTVLNRVQK